MPLPTIADTIRASVEGLLANGHTWANVWHFRKTGALTFNGAIAVLDPILAAFYTDNTAGNPGWRYNASSQASLQRIRYLPLDNASAQLVYTHVVAGANAGDPLPANVALCVTLRTDLRGRRNRGRIYLTGFEESSNQGAGIASAGVVTNFTTKMGQLLTSLGGSGVSLVVASYGVSPPSKNHPNGQTWAPYSTNVTGYSIDQRWDTQRRRLRV